MNKRRLAFLGISLLSGAAAFVACGFPDVEFAPESGGAETGTPDGSGPGTDGASGDGTVTTDGGRPVNPDVNPDGGMMDATVIPDGSQRVDAEAGCCDCDGDQVKVTGGTCAFRAGDCDDGNKYIYPDAGFVASSTWDTTHVPTYDWDCDLAVTKQYTHSLGTCASHLKLSGCANFQGGYEGDPPCGTAGHYVITCAADGNLLNLSCTETAHDDRPQGCR